MHSGWIAAVASYLALFVWVVKKGVKGLFACSLRPKLIDGSFKGHCDAFQVGQATEQTSPPFLCLGLGDRPLSILENVLHVQRCRGLHLQATAGLEGYVCVFHCIRLDMKTIQIPFSWTRRLRLFLPPAFKGRCLVSSSCLSCVFKKWSAARVLSSEEKTL